MAFNLFNPLNGEPYMSNTQFSSFKIDFEDFKIEARVDKAKKDAYEIFNCIDPESWDLSTYLLYLRFFIASHYNIPLYSEYFDKRTPDELFLEAELIALKTIPKEKRDQAVMKSQKAESELSALADEMEFGGQKPPSQNKVDNSDDQWKDVADDFFKTGKFPGEE